MKIRLQKLKSKKGVAIDIFVVVLVVILLGFSIIFSSIYVIGSINTNLEAHRIARNYMLKIESYGYLNSDDSNRLKEKLESIGLSNIDISGTTLSEVNNGDDVYLDIHYDQTVKELNISNFKFKNDIKHEEINFPSTAKN